MSGDVFGNGMLLSNRLKLIAAFDHRSIFLDPDPDPHTSWMERERLFKIPRSSWHDYDASFISVGGGVFARAAKSIPLSVEVRNSLQIDRAELSPDELITAILKAPVDLLWFGGIGTYVRGPTESEEQIGDRSNDRVRVLGSDLRARVLAEGANLACTQRGRIAAARKGVRLNTDAIDNSAGVNTSDIEVNIKIALVTAERCGKLTNDERKTLLDEMTEEVAQLATRNNYLQGLALSLCEYRGAAETRSIQRLIHWLEGRGQFDRSIHALPDDALLMERISQGEGLTRPEFAVLLAHAKLALYEDILSSRIPDDPYFSAELASYFPSAIRSRFPEEIASHKLKREIISCRLANALINRCGPASAAGPYDEPGITAHAVVAAYVVVSASFRLEELNEAIDALDSSVPIQEQLALYSEVKDVLSDRMDWLARNEDLGGLLARNVDRFSCAVSELEGVHGAALPDKMLEEIRSRESDLKAMGVPIDLARRIASLRYISPTPEILSIADSTGSSLSVVATAYFETQDLLRLPAVFNAARSVSIASDFDQLALDSTLEAIGRSHRELVAEIVNQGGQPSSVDAWAGRRSRQLGAFVRTAESLGLQPTIAKVVVLERLLANLRAVVGQPLRALAG
jgi:glutamate dehydrogenase